MRTAVDFSCRLYRRVLRAYPPALRARFGQEMLEVFREQVSDAWKARGLTGLADVWACVFRELIGVALPGHLVLIREPALRLLTSLVLTLLLIQAFLWAVAPRVYCR
jgi:hypothetical protein